MCLPLAGEKGGEEERGKGERERLPGPTSPFTKAKFKSYDHPRGWFCRGPMRGSDTEGALLCPWTKHGKGLIWGVLF